MRGLKFFFIALILSIPFWFGVNLSEKKLDNFFFSQLADSNHQILAAQIAFNEKIKNVQPVQRKNTDDLNLDAKSAISVFIDDQGNEKILYEKDSEKKLPIASLSKLMTALVVLENYDLSKEIKVSDKSANLPDTQNILAPGQTFQVKYLLYPMLIESSNEAAISLANDYSGITEEKFVGMMNATAEKIGLQNTFFINPTGLDEKKTNYSSAADLVKLTQGLLKKPFIWKILSIQQFNLYGPELTTTNKLLEEQGFWPMRIVGGKTGYTEKAGGCLLLVLKAPHNKGFIVNIILGTNGTEDRFAEMKKLVNWTDQAYRW